MDLNETTVLKEINQDVNGEFLSARKNSSNNSAFPPENLKENNNKFTNNLDKTFEQENFNFTDFEDKATVDNSNNVNVCEVSNNNNENRNVEEIATNDKYLVRNPVNDTTIAGYSSDEETFAECNSYIVPEPKENSASPSSSSKLTDTVTVEEKCSKLSLTNLNFENLKIDDHEDADKTQTNLEPEEKENLTEPSPPELNETSDTECTDVVAFEPLKIDDPEVVDTTNLEPEANDNVTLPPSPQLNETVDTECTSVAFENLNIDEHEDLDKTTTEIVDDSKSEEDEEEGFKADETFEFEKFGLPNRRSSENLDENTQFASETSIESIMGKKIQDKDSGIFLENFVQNNLNVEFKVPNAPPANAFSINQRWCPPNHLSDEVMVPGNEFNFDADAFDIFEKKSELDDIRPNRTDSLLLRFDPLLNRPVPILLDALTATPIVEEGHIEEDKETSGCNKQANLLDITIETDQTVAVEEEPEQEVISLNSTITEEEPGEKNLNDSLSELQVRSPPSYDTEVIEVDDEAKTDDPETIKSTTEEIKKKKKKSGNCALCALEALHTKHETMSVQMVNDVKTVKEDDPVIETIISPQSTKEEYKMAEIEKKLKNQGIKSEDNDRKLKEFESREEALIKRISEKEKVIAKMNSVIEAYETTISEFISEKAQLTQRYEKKCIHLQESSQLNASHLLSLEDTFSDLHTKYERSKQMAINFKQNEEKLLAEKKQLNELLSTQEARYEKMKSHAMSQLQVANDKLENLSKNHAQELSKLKATLKKEEIARTAVAEQLQQKIRENEELVKICEELIGGGNVVSENS